jgi:hypothetical protein
VGLLVAAVAVVILVALFDLSAIASIGSVVALTIFGLVTVGHLRIRGETGARLSVLALGLATTAITLLTFVFTTLIEEPASIATLLAILLISVALDAGWSRQRQASELAPTASDPRL